MLLWADFKYGRTACRSSESLIRKRLRNFYTRSGVFHDQSTVQLAVRSDQGRMHLMRSALRDCDTNAASSHMRSFGTAGRNTGHYIRLRQRQWYGPGLHSGSTLSRKVAQNNVSYHRCVPYSIHDVCLGDSAQLESHASLICCLCYCLSKPWSVLR